LIYSGWDPGTATDADAGCGRIPQEECTVVLPGGGRRQFVSKGAVKTHVNRVLAMPRLPGRAFGRLS